MRAGSNGIEFHYNVEGPEDAPWLIFSNSLATDVSMWDQQIAALKTKFRIFTYDQRGHGETDVPAGAYNFDMLAADVIGLMDALSIARAHFCGLSMGGITGQALIQKYPERFDKLIICDCAAASNPAGAAQWAERIADAKQGGMDALVDITVGRWFSPEALENNAPVVDKVRQMIRKTPVNGFIGCASALSDFDFKAGLGEIKAPTLLIAGTKDAAFPGVKFLNGAIPGSKMVGIEGAGHLSNLEAPEAFTRALTDFLG
nr:MAG: 3-oxoadipate enol-lactonase [Hyphomicrobiales bacterium]